MIQFVLGDLVFFLSLFQQYDDPNSLANNVKRPLNVNAPLFMPQTTSASGSNMGNGGNILDQVIAE